MTPKIKNIIIFVSIGGALLLVYIFFIRSSTPTPTLVSTTGTVSSDASTLAANDAITQDFLSLLLNVNNIKLNTSILSDPAFVNLHDSSVPLVPDTNPGRPNPFAQFGNDAAPTTISAATTTVLPATSSITPATPGASGTTKKN